MTKGETTGGDPYPYPLNRKPGTLNPKHIGGSNEEGETTGED